MSVEAVRNYLKPFSIADHIIEFAASSATVEEAAEDLGCKPALIAKTMACMVGEKAVLVVCAGDAKLWSYAFKKVFGTKLKFVPANELTDIVGHPMGGVCPFAVKDGVETISTVRSSALIRCSLLLAVRTLRWRSRFLSLRSVRRPKAGSMYARAGATKLLNRRQA
jgi:prolyl-tRNA editing enzyme YbaK/EbsC (Cys-tRNA(Pro) deacylase)